MAWLKVKGCLRPTANNNELKLQQQGTNTANNYANGELDLSLVELPNENPALADIGISAL
jgi:hypothetical protein